MSATAPRIIRCPGCSGQSVYSPENAYRPFCSARCKNNDFGAWAAEAYRVQAQPDPADEDEPGESFTPNQ